MAEISLKKFGRFLKKLSIKNHSHQAHSHQRDQDSFYATPEGFLPIYIGEEKKRYLVPTTVFNSAAFKRLFDLLLGDEYDDVTPSGPLVLPCSPEMFEIVLARASPAGFVPIFVGEERKKYLVPTAAVNSEAFKILLDSYLADDYDDVTTPGPLALPCSADTFEDVLRRHMQQQQQQSCR